MKKATIVFLAVIFGLFLGSGSAIACEHGDDGGGHEMMAPEGGGHHGEGHVCPCPGMNGEQGTPDVDKQAPAKPDVKSGKSSRDMHQHHPGFDPKPDAGHVCPHHK